MIGRKQVHVSFEVLVPGDGRLWRLPHWKCEVCGVFWRYRTVRSDSCGGFVVRRSTCPVCQSGNIEFVKPE